MSVVEVSAGRLAVGHCPPVCAKSGVQTADAVDVHGTSVPGWAAPLFLMSVVAWVFVRFAAARPYEISVPLSAAAWQRYRRLRSAGWVALAAGGLAVLLGAARADTAGVVTGLAVLACAMVGLVVNDYVNAFGVRVSTSGTIVLSRVHPAFAAALQR